MALLAESEKKLVMKVEAYRNDAVQPMMVRVEIASVRALEIHAGLLGTREAASQAAVIVERAVNAFFEGREWVAV